MTKRQEGVGRRSDSGTGPLARVRPLMRSGLFAVAAAGTLALTAAASQAADITFFMGPYSASTPDSMQTMVANFQKANPGDKVDYQSAPWDSYDQKIATAAKSGQGPGLAMEYTFGKYISDNLLRPIKDWVDPKLQDDFIPVFLAPGQGYAVPDLASVRGTFLNTDLLTAAGVKGLPETFDDLTAALVAIQKSNPGVTPLGFVSTPDDIGPSYSYYLFGEGGAWIDDKGKFLMNSKESVAAMTYLKDLYDKKLLEQDVTADRGKQEERFQAGQTAILPTGNFFVTTLEKNVPNLKYAVGSLPHLASVQPFAVGVTDFFLAFDQGDADKNKAGADLAAFIFQPDNYVPWLAADGFLPVTKSAADAYRKAAPKMAPFLDNLQSAKLFPSGDTRWAQVVTIMSQTVQSILLGRATVEDGLNAAQAQIDALPTS